MPRSQALTFAQNYRPATNSLKEQQTGEQSLQNNFWSLAADVGRPEKQPIVFKGR